VRTPLLCGLKPGGQYVSPDLYAAGGVPLVLKWLKEAGMLHEHAQTVTGKTVGEVADAAVERDGQKVVRPLDEPIKQSGGLAILHGNLAPEGCVVKLAGHERLKQSGPARVFESEEDAMAAVAARTINAGDMIVIRNEGPAGGPGMNRSAAARSGLVRDGDQITLDLTTRRLDVALSDEELAARANEYAPPSKPDPGRTPAVRAPGWRRKSPTLALGELGALLDATGRALEKSEVDALELGDRAHQRRLATS
jgi:dihydroxy-acid dehydratase